MSPRQLEEGTALDLSTLFAEKLVCCCHLCAVFPWGTLIFDTDSPSSSVACGTFQGLIVISIHENIVNSLNSLETCVTTIFFATHPHIIEIWNYFATH